MKLVTMYWLPAELLSGNYAVTGQQKLCFIIQVGSIITSRYLGKNYLLFTTITRILRQSYQFLLQLGEYITFERRG